MHIESVSNVFTKFLAVIFVSTFGINVWGIDYIDEERKIGHADKQFKDMPLSIKLPTFEEDEDGDVKSEKEVISKLKRTAKFVNLKFDFFQISSPKIQYGILSHQRSIEKIISSVAEFNAENSACPGRAVRSFSVDSGDFYAGKSFSPRIITPTRGGTHGGVDGNSRPFYSFVEVMMLN